MIDDTAAFSGTMQVAERNALDVNALTSWMDAHVEGFAGPPRIEQFKGGQSNPTFKITASSGEYVLRRKPRGLLLASAHAVDREYRVLRALHGTDVPVARPYALCEDDSIIGSVFYVMNFVDGRVMWNQLLPDVAPADRRAMFDALGDTIAKLHAIDSDAVGLADYGRPGNYLARQIGRWGKQYRASETETIEAMDRLIEWLPTRIPPDARTCIVHGDYRLDNVIFHPTEPRIVAVLDWELSTLGDPLVDFAYHAMSWRLAPALFRGFAGVDLASLNIPSETEYVAAYCRRTGRTRIDNWEYYVVFGMFRIAAIMQGIAKRARDGTAASEQAVVVGKRCRPIAEQAWELAQSLG